MPKTRKVIGEGSYGCVHDPSLHCVRPPKPKFKYKGYVSKLMKTRRAEEELAEFVKFHHYDPKDEYHLGTPFMCKPDLQEAGVMAEVTNCNKISNDITTNPNQYDILVMKYGGPDLKIFCKDKITQYLKTNKQEKSDHFWLEVHHLIKGLQFFRDSGIVHNDLKPQNILYDIKTHKLSYIDFGLMETKDNIIKTSKNNTNTQAVFHWSYPMECGFMSYSDYSKFKRGVTNGYQRLVKKELFGMIVSGNNDNTANLKINRPDAFEIFFSYINPTGKNMAHSGKYAFLDEFFDGIEELVKVDYDTYLDRIIDSIDVHGLGFTLQYILNCFKRHKAVSDMFFTKCSALFSKMYDADITSRELDINVLLDEYEDICLETGLLTRMNKRFENNDLVNSPPMPSPIMRLANSEDSSEHALSSELEQIAYMDAVAAITKKCPLGKELNPKTGRCIKKCGPYEIRNSQGRCVKNKTRKQQPLVWYNLKSNTKSITGSKSKSKSSNSDFWNEQYALLLEAKEKEKAEADAKARAKKIKP
jgi:serine/threonine protein kinase